MNHSTENQSSRAEEDVRKYFREVVDNHKLPSLPMVASKVLEMLQDPDVSAQKLCRVLSDDAALAARVLAVSRSPHFAQRTAPTNLVSAVQVLGFQNVSNIVLANATHSLCIKGNVASEKLWDHSLAVALTMRVFSKRTGMRNGDQAFLAGLMHDVGEMILVHGDPKGFAMLGEEARQSQCQMADKEKARYGFDHALIGYTLLDSWNIDSQIGQVALNHHGDAAGDGSTGLAAMVAVADYLCFEAGLGFFAAPPAPAQEALAQCRCDDDQSIGETIQAIRKAYDEESALFRSV